jgi:hypothetical protein
MNKRAAKAELLPHSAGQLLCRPIGKGGKSRTFQELFDPPLALLARLAKQPSKELDIFLNAEIGIEVFAELCVPKTLSALMR